MTDKTATSHSSEIRKGGIGVNVRPQGQTAPQGPLSNFTHKPSTGAPATSQPTQAQGKK